MLEGVKRSKGKKVEEVVRYGSRDIREVWKLQKVWKEKKEKEKATKGIPKGVTKYVAEEVDKGTGAMEAMNDETENGAGQNEDRKISNNYFSLNDGADMHKKFEKDQDNFQNRHDKE